MAEDPRHSKSTLTFDRGQLAELTAASRVDPVEEIFEDLAQGTEPTRAPAQMPSIGRTETISDPLTMALLAEVARNSQTIEIDPEKIAEAEQLDVPHPHVKRRV